jgi:carbamoylphosphate synthase large subunit
MRVSEASRAGSKLRLLLLSVGSLAAQNVIDAIGLRREHCFLIGTNSLAEAAGNFRCDRAYITPPAAAQTEYIERLKTLIEGERPHLIVPTRDEDVVALAVLREQWPIAGSSALAGSVAAARVWYDKVETARFAKRHNLPFAPTAISLDEALAFARSYGLPLIGKPRAGNGSRGVVLLRSTQEIQRAFETRADLIAQPYLDPPADTEAFLQSCEAGLPLFFSFPESGQYVITVIIGPDGRLLPPFGWLCTLIGGQSIRGERCDDRDFVEIASAYARAAAAEGWRGPLNVQLKRASSGKLVAFELNGRFGGGTAARTCVGFDEVGEAIRRFVPNADFPQPRVPHARIVQKYLRSYAIPDSGLRALASERKWTRSTATAASASQPSDALRLMVLSVGSLAAQRFLESLGTRRDQCFVIGTNSLAAAAGNFLCDSVHLVPVGSDVDRYLEVLERLIEREQPDIVIPTRDDDVFAVAMLRERRGSATPVLLAGSVAAARMMQDKLETARFAARHGLPFAPTEDNLEGALKLARTYGLPLIGKPRRGTASRGVVLLRSHSEIERAFRMHADFLVQMMLDPPPNIDALAGPFTSGLPFFFSFPEDRQYFLQVVIGPDGAISPAFATLSTQFFGQAIRTERCDDPELLDLAQTYARAVASEGWRGPLNVQVKRGRDGEPLAHELNGRFSGGTAARALLGFDEPAEVISRFLPTKMFPARPRSTSRIVQNYMHTLPIPTEALADLRVHCSWTARATC